MAPKTKVVHLNCGHGAAKLTSPPVPLQNAPMQSLISWLASIVIALILWLVVLLSIAGTKSWAAGRPGHLETALVTRLKLLANPPSLRFDESRPFPNSLPTVKLVPNSLRILADFFS
jgi:hypothetical protein